MVKYSNSFLDQAFHCLSHPTRRHILQQLSSFHTLSVSQISKPLNLSAPAISKHLKVLEQAALIVRHKEGSTHFLTIHQHNFSKLSRYVSIFPVFWSQQLPQPNPAH